MRRNRRVSLFFTSAILLAAACGDSPPPTTGPSKPAPQGKAPSPANPPPNADAKPHKPENIKVDKGVDLEKHTVRIGTLNDESGPAAVIGRPYAIGKRLVAARINAGGSGLLPEGWKVELVERDHGYNPQNSVQAYNDIKDDVLFIGTSFGTPNTLPLRPLLEQDNMVAFPASLSSKMAEHAHTPPLGAAYQLEAERAMDWIIEKRGGVDKIKPAIVYQNDDYGNDGLTGWKAAAARYGVTLCSEHSVAPGQKDFTAIATALKAAGCHEVLLTTLPSATATLMGTGLQMSYTPIWVGNTPSWIDKFFVPEVVPPAVFLKFYLVSSLPYWDEPGVPGMDRFLDTYEQFGKEMSGPDFFILASYIQGLAQIEAFRRAMDKGDMTRAGYRAALKSMNNFDAGGLIQPIDLSKFPYVTGTKTRILRPNIAETTWIEIAPYAEPNRAGAPATAGN